MSMNEQNDKIDMKDFTEETDYKRGKRKNSFQYNSDDEECHNYAHRPRKKQTEKEKMYEEKIVKKSKTCDYFKKQTKKKQIEIIDKEIEIEKFHHEEVPIRYRILFSSIAIQTKSLIIQKIDYFDSLTQFDSEYSKLNKWVKGISRIPFDRMIEMPVSISDSSIKIQKFLYDAQIFLDKTIYGQLEAKNKMIQIMGQWIANPNSRGQVIALEGPPGVGKTSLIKSGVSKALGRPFCFYALGGASDASNLEGHSYTYEGAIWGRIVDMLMEARVMNPIIFFDELDKISDTARGHEITGVLTHLTDPSQNNTFHDKYFAGIDFDISKTLFFFSYNDVRLINPILKDRLTIIEFSGYNMEEKINIAENYILPELMENIGFNSGDLVFTKDVLKYIVTKFGKDEQGVRTVRKSLEDIIMKLNLLRLLKGTKNEEESEKVENRILIDYEIDNFGIPCELTVKMIDILTKNSSLNPKKMNPSLQMLYL